MNKLETQELLTALAPAWNPGGSWAQSNGPPWMAQPQEAYSPKHREVGHLHGWLLHGHPRGCLSKAKDWVNAANRCSFSHFVGCGLPFSQES